MKYGIMTDIHSNPLALKAVLKKFEEIKVDKILCAGDLIGIGPEPDEAVKMMMKLKDNVICVRGNHEEYFLKELPTKATSTDKLLNKEEIDCHLWNQNQLSTSSEAFLSELPEEIVIYDEGKKICILHYPREVDGRFKKEILGPTVEQALDLFKQYDADIFIYGHSHAKSLILHQGKAYLNFGSLGCPKETNKASAGVLYVDSQGIGFDMLDVEYDAEKVVKEIKNLKYPNYEDILKSFYGGR